MAQRITIDPVTRIEGHLRVDVEVDAGAVKNAWVSGTMWRGIENILLGRDPREAWIFAQRFCGVCTTVHAIASVRAVENALSLSIPLNAQYIRNLILIAHAMHDHIVHFYHLSALDWVDVVSATKGDPAQTSALAESISPWTRNSKNDLKAVKERISGFVAGGRLGIFTNGYWGHPAMRLNPNVNLLAVSHYLQALEFQRLANQIVAILGSKTPNIQNMAVGGVTNAINLNNQHTLNMQRLANMKSMFDQVIDFVQQVYFVDACAVAGMYPDWFKYGAGVKNLLAIPDLPLDVKGTMFDLPGGFLFNGDPGTLVQVKNHTDERLLNGVTENTTHAYYKGGATLPPWKGETVPDYHDFDTDGKYSWVKAPRFEGKPMQVGPLAQVLVGYHAKHPLTVKWTDKALGIVSSLAGRTVTVKDMHSTMGRLLARAIRTAVISELAAKHWQLLVDNIASGDTAIYNEPIFPVGEIQGVGFHEAPRGMLSHWTVIREGKIANYQAVVPTTWNAGPRDEANKVGPYEASLMDNPVADAKKPLEVLRTVHSFDPCLACAVHTLDVEGNELAKVQTLDGPVC
ncbi:MAG: nickel-dependent hydrogenase large subunit [Bacteroidetes bacterium]|nr:MAG: nickel-dependent hydrogenase large subunit [Bacteroidota bacterium]